MPDIGTEEILHVECRDRNGRLSDPDTFTGHILPPKATVSLSLTFVRQSIGVYEAKYIPQTDGEFWWDFQSTGTPTVREEHKFVVEPRKVPASLPTAIPQIPVISRGLPTYSRIGANQPESAVDGIYATLWRSVVSPNGGQPQYLVIDKRSVLPADAKNTWIVWKGHVTTQFGGGVVLASPGSALGSQAVSNYTYLAADYKIQGHKSMGGLPADNDPGWVDIVAVTNNSYHTRIHDTGDLSIYGWIRFYCTRSSGVTGITDDVGLEIDIRNVTNGTVDSIMAYGDSITEEAFSSVRPDNAFWVNVGPFEDSVEAQTSRWAPIIVDGATIGWTAALLDQYKADYIPLFPCKYVFIAVGSNDANGASIDLNTVGGINSTYAKSYKGRLQSMINYCYSLGKIAVIPHIPWGDLNTWSTPNIIILNTMIDQVIAANVGKVLAGPDFYTFFSNNHAQLADHLHPTYDNATSILVNGRTGYENYIQMWLDWLVTHLYT